nr:reverse transcriptase domain-containing protein [Tanacetum cinerariifolium]
MSLTKKVHLFCEISFKLRTIIQVAPMVDNRTMEELLQAPMEGYGEAIVITEINADHCKIKMNLLQLVQANPYHGFERENPNTHITNFKRITSTLKFKDVPNDVIKLMMENASKTDDRIDKLADQISVGNKMYKAFPLPGESSHWQYKFPLLVEGAGGNLLSKTTREALQIIKNKSKVHYSRNKSNVSRMNTTFRENASKTDDRIDKLADQISVGNKMHKAFPLPGESSHWQYKFSLPV